MIKVYKNFLDETFLQEFTSDLKNKINTLDPAWTSNLGWNQNIIKSSSVVLMHQIKDQNIINTILKEYKKINKDIRDLTICFYVWTKGSYIPLHRDNHPNYTGGSTIYLNENWHPDWGGLYLWQDDNKKFHAEVPEFNQMILNDSFVNHGTTLISQDAQEFRLTLQVFFLK
jgi:Rps23 Pro-64 3,4-dihydroxylase Tpa1-like proline 4-hydroxylase